MQRAVEQFVGYLDSEAAYAPGTRRAYTFEVRRFGEFMGETAIGTVTAAHLRMFMAKVANTNGAAGQRRAGAALRSFFKWLAATRRLKPDLFEGLQTPPAKRQRPEHLGRGEVARLRAAVEEGAFPPRLARDRAIVELMLNAGVRLSEIAPLNRDDVNLRAWTITLGHGEGRREIPMNSRLHRVIAAHLGNRRDREDGALFTNHRGMRLTRDGIYYLVKRYLRAAGIVDAKDKASPTTLRHTFRARLLERGASLAIVQELTGLASPTLLWDAPAMAMQDAVELLE